MRALFVSLCLASSWYAQAQSRDYFIEANISPGLTLSGDTGANLSLHGSAGLRRNFFAAELILGDLLFRDAKTATSNTTFISLGARLFVPSGSSAEAFFRGSIGGGAFFDVPTLTSSSTVVSSFGAGVQLRIKPQQSIGAALDLYSIQPTTREQPLAAGSLSLRFAYLF
jgi:hypothetical protein